jgi:hypothetical protein
MWPLYAGGFLGPFGGTMVTPMLAWQFLGSALAPLAVLPLYRLDPNWTFVTAVSPPSEPAAPTTPGAGSPTLS